MKLHVVIFNPAIVLNVGNIARTCYGFDAKLHLIRPYGFIFDKAKLKRSSTNHFDLINLQEYDNWEDFIAKNSNNAEMFFYSRWGNKTPNQIDIKTIVNNNTNANIYLIFGNEQTGIPKQILTAQQERVVRIPMYKDIVCLNVANTVSIACYEVLRQLDYLGLYKEGK